MLWYICMNRQVVWNIQIHKAISHSRLNILNWCFLLSKLYLKKKHPRNSAKLRNVETLLQPEIFSWELIELFALFSLSLCFYTHCRQVLCHQCQPKREYHEHMIDTNRIYRKHKALWTYEALTKPTRCTDQATSLELGICSTKNLPAQLQERQAPELPISQFQRHCTKIMEKNSTEFDCFIICDPKPWRNFCRSVSCLLFSSTSYHNLKPTCLLAEYGRNYIKL